VECGGLEGVSRGQVRGAGVGRLLDCVKFSSVRESCFQTCNFKVATSQPLQLTMKDEMEQAGKVYPRRRAYIQLVKICSE
jgi:hypothetical protein